MTVQIDNGRLNIEKMRTDMRWEARKFLVSAILAVAAATGAGVGIGNLIWARRPSPAPQVVILQQPAPAQK